MIGDFLGAIVADIRHLNALARRRVDVDDVDPDAVTGDDAALFHDLDDPRPNSRILVHDPVAVARGFK